ncbi:MAG: hypothetical protein ACR2KT_16805 [Methylocella sp.]
MSKSPAGDGGRAKRGAFLFGRTRGLFIANKLPFVLGAAVLFAAMGVVAANTGGSSTPATSALTSTVVAAVSPAAVISAAASVPVISTLPVISGVAQVGQTLTATNGTWANSPTSFTYQWNRAGAAISGATASSYVPVVADIGNTLTVSVIASNASGPSSPATSAATAAVISSSGVIAISGTVQVGQTLTVSGGSGVIQWFHEGSAISGATSATYLIPTGDIGNIISVSQGGTMSPLTAPVIGAMAFYVSNSTWP